MLRGLKFYGFFTIISIKPKTHVVWHAQKKNRRERFEKRNGYRT